MSTKTKRTSSTKSTAERAEARRAEMEQLHERLTAQVEALRTSDEWSRYLDFCRSFHSYSLNNLILILSQMPTASRVAGYRAWQGKGRQVRKGERGLRIFGTGTVKRTEEDPETGEEIEGKRRVFFPVSVFDISQTDLMEGEEDRSTIAHALTGEDQGGIIERVVAYLTGTGVAVEFGPIHSGAQGYTTPADEKTGEPVRVVIKEDNEPAQQAKTLLHEAAHITLGHLDDDFSEYVAHRGRYEVEAESVAYVLAGLLGLDSSAYSVGYVAGWAEGDAEVIRETAARVLAAVHTLAEALTEDAAAQEQATTETAA